MISQMLLRRVALLAFALGFAVPGAVCAESKKKAGAAQVSRQPKQFAAADRDGDGRVSEAEFVEYEIRRRFAKADTNKDGRLSREEFLASAKGSSEQREANAKWKLLNGGKRYVTVEDKLRHEPLKNEMREEFKKLDQGGKGYLTKSDWNLAKP